jgi:hypothetical protein
LTGKRSKGTGDLAGGGRHDDVAVTGHDRAGGKRKIDAAVNPPAGDIDIHRLKTAQLHPLGFRRRGRVIVDLVEDEDGIQGQRAGSEKHPGHAKRCLAEHSADEAVKRGQLAEGSDGWAIHVGRIWE